MITKDTIIGDVIKENENAVGILKMCIRDRLKSLQIILKMLLVRE